MHVDYCMLKIILKFYNKIKYYTAVHIVSLCTHNTGHHFVNYIRWTLETEIACGNDVVKQSTICILLPPPGTVPGLTSTQLNDDQS